MKKSRLYFLNFELGLGFMIPKLLTILFLFFKQYYLCHIDRVYETSTQEHSMVLDYVNSWK